MIDLRSDTVTKPTPAMRRAMAEAEVGDDVYGEDPTVNRLQERAAELFGKEAALFVPTGSMGNQIAVKLHTRPGTEVVIEERGHIYNFEMAAMSAVSGALARPVKSGDGSGVLTWQEIESAVHGSDAAYYVAPTRLVAIENSHNLAGGTLYTRARTEEICERAHSVGLPVHLDGARLFNAAEALGEPVAALARPVDSVMFCLSKGLGAPVGSMLLGRADFIEEARAWRKLLGGGMRQAGVLAAAALVALEETPPRLAEDHANARRLAEGLAELPGVLVDPERVVTNIVLFDVSETGRSAGDICARLRSEHGVLASGFGTSIRMVTHYDVSREQIESALAALREVLKQKSEARSQKPELKAVRERTGFILASDFWLLIKVMTRRMIIAIDGPSGAGKSTLSRLLARELGLLYVDTGSMYRAAALAVIEAGVNTTDTRAVAEAVARARIQLEGDPDSLRVSLDGRDVSEAIRAEQVTHVSSVISAIPEVRRDLVRRQRELGEAGGVVMNGRDTGTVIFPDADVKFFLTARPEERARRRYDEERVREQSLSYDETLADINARDRRDSTRADSPLAIAADAVVIDTTDLSVEEVFRHMVEVARAREAGRGPA